MKAGGVVGTAIVPTTGALAFARLQLL
jgi:hypothetical protein